MRRKHLTNRQTRGDVEPATVDFVHLSGLSMSELRCLWSELIGRATPPVQKALLMREIAWRVQERIEGGLDAEASRLLKRAIRTANSHRDSVAGGFQIGADEAHPEGRWPCSEVSASRAAAKIPSTSTRLVRVWRGVTHEVLVLDGGRQFRYRDQTYQSLSEIAREITGTRWSGPRFFGLAPQDEGDEPNSGAGSSNGRRRRTGGAA